jgi:glycosyltransferase involved in cell wall biosynthesis
MVLSVSRLTPYKQVDVLVEAIPLVLEAVPSAKFVFVGGGRLMSSLKARCESLDITGSVKFVGFQPTERVLDYLAAASVVWIPMSGFVVLEAAAAAKPIVAFDVEWHNEFIESNVNGILVRNRDRIRLAEAVIDLLQNPAKAQELGRNARARLLRDYDPRRLIDHEIEVYKEMIRACRER